MVLLLLLLVPILLGLGGLVFSHGRVTWKEFLCHEVIMVVLVGVAYYIALHGQMADTEIWNGTVAKKWKDDWQSCCHSYRCNCRSCNCNSKGQNCSECCDTCYEHSHDVGWYARSSNGEMVFSDGCNAPYSSAPSRWERIVVGEPTAVEHSYKNYIKGNPDSILRRQGQAQKYASLIPAYPPVYDLYRADRFLTVGVTMPDRAALNRRLAAINARLGAPRQVNITVIVVATTDSMYLEGLREAWLGGKKNDFIAVVGVAPGTKDIAWAGALSWTRNEELKISVRDRLAALPTLDGGQILDIVEAEVGSKFVRRPMADFEYLESTVEPPNWAKWLIGLLGAAIAVALQVYFWNADPFGDERRGYFRGRRGLRW